MSGATPSMLTEALPSQSAIFLMVVRWPMA